MTALYEKLLASFNCDGGNYDHDRLWHIPAGYRSADLRPQSGVELPLRMPGIFGGF
jgi:hypothetical protein